MRGRRQGMALIAVLGILAVLIVLASSLAVAVRTETRLALTSVRRTQASWLAEAGLQRAFVELRDDPNRFTALSEDAEEGQPLVLLLDSEDEESLALQDGRFTVRGFDEAALINLNVAAEEVLSALLYDEPDLVDAILDWRDSDGDSRLSGAEDEYYAALEDPYTTRGDWFDTVGEMLLLRDVTPARFFGDELSPLASAETAGTIDESRTPLLQLFTTNSYDANLDLDGGERINLNEADREELLAQFEGVLDEQDVDAILTARDGASPPPGPAGDEPPSFEIPELPEGFELPLGEEAAAPGEAGAQERAPSSVAELLGAIDREKVQRIYDRVTASGDAVATGLVNLNTASAEVLAALPGMDAALADAILAARSEEPFETVGDLLRLTEITDEVFESLAPLVTTRSLLYRLVAEGAVGEGEEAWTRRIEAVVQVELTPAEASSPAERPAPDATAAEAEAPRRRLRLIYRRME